VALWSRRPALIIGWLFFLGTLAPVLGLVQVGLQASADRYTYIPSIGLAIMVADLASVVASRSHRHRQLVLVVFGCIMAGSAVGTVAQVDLWRSQSVLFEHAVAVTGPNPTARAILASALLQEHRAAEAVVHASEAVRLSPIDDHVDLLGRTLVAVGQPERAIPLLSPLCARQPPHVASCVHLGEALLGTGDVIKAREAAARASATAPGVSEVEVLVAQTLLAPPDANPVLALRSAKSAMQRLDDRADAHALTVFAEALAANAQRADALRVIDIALDVAAGEGDVSSSTRLTTLRATLAATPP
jgi:predicted Zn-dependent protease